MTLPEGYSPTEHFQDVAKRLYNRDVREWFSEITNDELDISTPRQSLRTACTHQDEDSLLMTVGRMWLFESAIRKPLSTQGSGTTSRSATVLRRTKPKVRLYFQEDIADVEPGYPPVDGEITFRLMNETPETITPTNATTLANKINLNFANAGGFVWKKGKIQACYADWDKGYQLQPLVRDRAEAKRVIGQILEIQGHAPDWENLTYNENDSPATAFPTIPQTDYIFGESRRLPRRRPVADVRFQYASLEIPGVQNAVCLVDRSGTWPNPLVS